MKLAIVTFALPNGELRVATVEAGTQPAAIALGKIALSQWHKPESLTFVCATYRNVPPYVATEPFGV